MNENKDLREEATNEAEGGKINISNDVIASIAGIAATEIEGVAGMAGSVASGLAEKLGAKKNPQKGVKVTVTDEGAVIDLLIVVAFGVRIPELCWEIQENVKNSVESMTGTEVIRVNVFVEGVSFEKKKKAPKSEDLIDDDVEETEDTAEVLEVTEE
ncbi:MAG: Asp23/Gls24 family envelope stress response protein [Clostridia bacterium]|nr:Asp23/Gls24 family envelope stress response protein [Clostridia bacterium]